jgi:RHS repeat-associated protein
VNDPAYVYTYDAEGNRASREALAVRNAIQGGVQMVDNTPSTSGGSWTTTGVGYGGSQQVGTPTLNSRATASWQASTLPAGSYDVYATWSSIDNGLTSAPYTLTTTDGGITTQTITSAPVDFTKAPAGLGYGGANWRLIGQVNSSGTSTVTIALSTGTALFAGIAADAILFKPTGLDVARTTYEWDHQNRLTKVTNESAAFAATGAATLSPRDTTTYAYDVLGRRAAVTYDLVGPADGGGDFRRVSVYDGSQVVWTETGTNREQMVSQGTTQAMLWAPGTDQLLAIQERLGGSGLIKQPVWTLTDHLGTVKDYLAKAPTAGAESGLLLTRQYSTFGTPLSAKQWVNVPTGGTSFTDINGKSGFFYVGQEYDASTGLQYSRARYYDPVSSEFISQDPLGFAGGDTNLYRRDGNQSVSARPRDRNWAEWAWESGAAAASTIGNALKLAVDPRTQLSVGYDLFLKDSATAWGNTAGMPTASRLGITAGFFVGDLTGLRGVDDFFHTHDAADAHVQSRTEQWFDGVFGAIGVAGTIAGGGAVAKTVQTLGVKGTVAAGAAYARATVARVGTGARGLVDDVLRVGKNVISPRWGAQIDAGKFDYLFGNAARLKNAAHNAPRTAQNLAQMKRLGLFNDTTGRRLLRSHFDDVVNDATNVTRRYSNQYGGFEVRESLFAGPSGQFAKFESTWEVLSDGTRRLTTVIPFGGQ